MKKLVFGMCIVLLSLKGYGQTTSQLCLNGYTLDEAKAMITKFRNENIVKPLETSVWFDMATVHQIATLLTKEKSTTRPALDGVRIYFGKDRTKNLNTVILVSTDSVKDGHKDYFDHDPSLVPSNHGDIHNDDCNGGARLYTHCALRVPPPACPCLCVEDASYKPGPNQITRKYAEAMVFNFGRDVINSRAEWFSLSTIASLDDSKYDGVRIYFARRTSDEVLIKDRDRDAFVIENTKTETINNIQVDVDHFEVNDTTKNGPGFMRPQIRLNNDINKIIKKLKAQNPKMSNLDIMKKIKFMKDTLGVEEGELCPDHCDDTSPLFIIP